MDIEKDFKNDKVGLIKLLFVNIFLFVIIAFLFSLFPFTNTWENVIAYGDFSNFWIFLITYPIYIAIAYTLPAFICYSYFTHKYKKLKLEKDFNFIYFLKIEFYCLFIACAIYNMFPLNTVFPDIFANAEYFSAIGSLLSFLLVKDSKY